MNAQLKLIEVRPLLRPLFTSNSLVLSNRDRWIDVNHVLLWRYWEAQAAYDGDAVPVSFRDWSLVQYDIECQMEFERRARAAERESEKAERDYDRSYDRDTGIAKYGEI